MKYAYSGFLRSILYKPDAAASAKTNGIDLTADDLARWSPVDEPSFKEWQHIPVQRSRSEHGVTLEGRFADVRRIDVLDADDPRYWVALSSLRWDDPRLPVDVRKYPILEITYRCLTEHATPQFAYGFSGGSHRTWLPCSREWHTIAHKVCHDGFPSRLDWLVVRLFSAHRTTETIEIQSIRFREFTPAEAEALHKNRRWADALAKPRPFDVLAQTIPLGVCMDAAASKCLSQILGISQREYWGLVMEDLVRHNHNAVAISHIEALSGQEWGELLQQAESFELKFVVMHEYPLHAPPEEKKALLDTWVLPFVDSPAIFTWSLFDQRSESDLEEVMRAKQELNKLIPNQPFSMVTRGAAAYPYYAPYFAASGIFHNLAHRPWDVGKIVSAHHHLVGGQQFWMVAPAFVHATDTPEWSTCPEMRLMVNLAFANGARGWFAFTYHNEPYWIRGHCQRSLTGPFLAFSDLWSELGERMRFFDLMMPLLVAAKPEGSLKKWHVTTITSETDTVFPEDVGPVGIFRMRNDDFQLIFILNNDTAKMAGFNLHIPSNAIEGQEVYDFSDYIAANSWEPMDRRRHLEMFPGQMKVLMIAAPEVCEFWRRTIGLRIVDYNRRRLEINLRLARSHDLPVADIEAMVDDVLQDGDPDAVAHIQNARNELIDRLYDSPAIHDSRSKIIEATAALCGCDGTLCRMLGRGKVDEAHAFSERVLSLAREVTQLRIALREGKGMDIGKQAEAVAKRATKLLAEIRSTS